MMIITAGLYKGRKIITPDEKITRPTLSKVRMSVFNTLYSIIGDFEGKSFLDVFTGSGIMGLEAISRGFSFVKGYEKNPKVLEIAKKNYSNLNIKSNLILGDSIKLLKKETNFDVAYIDPPYKSGIYEEIIKTVNANILILEHDTAIEYQNLEIITQKKYGNCHITFLKNIQNN